MIQHNGHKDEMELQDDNPLVIGYASAQIGNIFYPEAEHYRPIIICCNSIVQTVDGPAVVTSVHAGVTVRAIEVES